MPYNSIKRRSLGGLKELKRFIYEAFVLPFKDGRLAYIYFTSLLFSFGFAFLDMFLLLDISKMSMEGMLQYLCPKYFFLLTIVTGTIFCVSRYNPKLVYATIATILAAALIYTYIKQDSLTPLEIGMLYGLFTSPFWGIFHVIFAVSTSKSNIGNEVSLAGTGMTLGTSAGFLAGGLFLGSAYQEFALIIGFSFIATATFCLILYAIKLRLRTYLRGNGALDESMKEAFLRCRYRSLGSVFEGIFNLCAGNLWIVFMAFNGIAAAMVGVWNALMIVIKIIFTPIAGSLVNHGQRREMLLGSSLTALGWAPLLFTNALILPAMYIWSIGAQLYATGLSSAWYSSRTISSLMVREIILGITRVSFLFVLVPLLYADSFYFVAISVFFAVLMVIYSIYWRLNIKLKGPVLPFENKIMTSE